MPKILATHPAGASLRQTVHFSQLYLSGKFRKYDFGYIQNYYEYGVFEPPEYKTENIKANTYFYYGENDYLSNPEDILVLSERIQSICSIYKLPIKTWNHMDFLWSNDVKKYINEPIKNKILDYDKHKRNECI